MRQLVSLIVLGLCCMLLSASVHAQRMASYYSQYDLLSSPPSAVGEGLSGFANPALPALQPNTLQLQWSTDGRDHGDVSDIGVFSSVGGLSGAVSRVERGGFRSTGYHVGLAGGTKRFATGIAYQGFAGDKRAFGRVNRLTTGAIARPSRYLSVGLTYNIGLETDDREWVGEVGVRPLGTSRLTVFGDMAVFQGDALRDAPWSVGGAIQVVPGVEAVGRYFESEAFSLGLRVNLDRAGVQSQARFNPSQAYASSAYGIRLGGAQPSAISEAVQRGGKHVVLELGGTLSYQQSQVQAWTQDGVGRFYEALRTIERAGASERVQTLALNLSGLRIQPALAWELRQALQEAQAAGTTVLVYIDYAGMNTYHIASVADHVIMDPVGRLTLDGYASSQTFLAGTLDKIGIAVDDWRLFSHKSALEALDRTDFSDAEREQRQAYIDAFYETVRTDVMASRGLDNATFDSIVNDQTLLWATDAESAGLIDGTGRWSDLDDLLDTHVGGSTSALSVDALNELHAASDAWSAPPTIALVYGIGGTSIDSGMKAKELAETIRSTADRDDVKAIVFRVDSPGGDPLAADLVAEALREASEDMPVIISQGQVAGSGGYWVSMYGDEIFAAPTTLTGSIGVVAGWIYDDGFSERAGFDYDVVQRGERADLTTGYNVPLLGVELPARDMTKAERDRTEAQIEALYDEFVSGVAEGRSLDVDSVRTVAEGRVWTGTAAQERGLVDTMGGLPAAIEAARTAAELDRDWVQVQEVNAISGFFGFETLIPAPIRALVSDRDRAPETYDPVRDFVRTMATHQPHPLVILPPGWAPAPRP
ncbi:hypothetical protein CRI93_10995 [Longimonas halophila]|uniref:Peptidase S49 domain-containing protein n=1 Tax=Longimonas halophila TaxID=1469170 RepID=A0A2H3NJM1_9BACT|nr:S49 family peptidase [Longimonas halophila]PEN06000.1 hypothetical protein CRI93_10995 [Longimonas halophila]